MSRIPTKIYHRLPHRLPPYERYSNYCLGPFDGVAQYVEIAHAPSLSITDELTIEVWGKFVVVPVGFVAKGRTVNPNYWFRTESNRLMFWYGSDYIRGVAATAVPLNRWTRLGVTVKFSDGVTVSDVKFYVDERGPFGGGWMWGSDGIGVPPTNTDPVDIMRWMATYSAGYIDEVRILNVIQAPYQMRESFYRGYALREASSVLNLRMEEGTGLTTLDDSGYGNNGALKPAATPPPWTPNRLHELLAEAGA